MPVVHQRDINRVEFFVGQHLRIRRVAFTYRKYLSPLLLDDSFIRFLNSFSLPVYEQS